MAYLDTAFRYLDHESVEALSPTFRIRVDLDPLSRQVALLSRRDTRGSLMSEARLVRLFRILFGTTGARPLANARLEALRRFCVLDRQGDPRGEEAAASLVAQHGYTDAQLAIVSKLVRSHDS